MSERRPLRVAAPSAYALRAESDVGGERYERELVLRLPDHGIDQLLAVPAPPGIAPGPGVTVDVRPWLGDLHWAAAPTRLAPWAARLLRAGQVDVLRAPSVRFAAPSLLLARALARVNAPVVVHHHHFTERWRAVEARILRRADAVITVSEHSRGELLAAGVDPRRVHVVLDGVGGPRDRTPEPPSTWPADGIRLLHVGRLETRKRPELALDTLAALTRVGTPASLVLAGDGPLRETLRAHAAAAGVSERVAVLGRVSDARKWALYDGAELLLFGSELEGFGLVVAEAQSRGLPVVAAAGTATGEAMDPGRGGLLVPAGAEAFAGAVRSLLASARRAEMARAARAFGRRFDWDACAAAVAAILREAHHD